MKKYSIIILCLLFLVACQQENNPPSQEISPVETAGAETVNPNDYELTPLKGSEWQLAEQRNAEGEVTVSGYLDEAGRKQGSWTSWKGSRSPTKIMHYVNGQLNGLYQEMDAVGRVTKVAHYFQGELHGRYAEYRAGIVQKTASYRNGELDGIYREHRLQNGTVNRSLSYKNGQLDGPMRWFNDDGELIQERMYRKGELIE